PSDAAGQAALARELLRIRAPGQASEACRQALVFVPTSGELRDLQQQSHREALLGLSRERMGRMPWVDMLDWAGK
ncbi:MAG TPA: hypothetical protein VFU47_10775, partial [Armatimonadota bacterium]|nr:hypothetical protein [Armatimonadota bacterium]